MSFLRWLFDSEYKSIVWDLKNTYANIEPEIIKGYFNEKGQIVLNNYI